MGTSETDTYVFLKPRSQWTTSSNEAGLVEKMNAELATKVPDAHYSWTQPIQMRMDDLLSGVRTQLAISIYGDDLDTLNRLAQKVVTVVQRVPGAADVSSESEGTIPYLHVDVDRDSAARLGVSVSDILAEVEAIGGHIGRSVTVDNAIIPTQVQFREGIANSQDKIAHLQIRRVDGTGWVLLADVAHISLVDGTSRIDRDTTHRRVVVQANVRGRDVNSLWRLRRQRLQSRSNCPMDTA